MLFDPKSPKKLRRKSKREFCEKRRAFHQGKEGNTL
jgi:hypothetical protein